MRFIKGTKLEIIVEQIGADKRPGLWVKSVTEENTIIKLASFANEEKANFFVTYLSKFLGLDRGDQNEKDQGMGIADKL